MTPRYGNTRLSKIRAAFDELRHACQVSPDERVRDAWSRCEAWIGWLYAEDKKHAPERCPYCEGET